MIKWSLIGRVQSIASMCMRGFQNNFAQLLSLMSEMPFETFVQVD